MKPVLNEKLARSLTSKTNLPVVFRGFIDDWTLCRWNLEKWETVFADREYPFRCVNKFFQSKNPCWERCCIGKKMTFKEFTKAARSSDEAMYFDYKYLHEWFSEADEIHEAMSWAKFGYPEKGKEDTTIWVGSEGAHTPAHQDTYGVNIVTQVYGKKRWILFPPESGGLKPTRVPYEESSVYSELNFYCPVDTQVFKGLTGAQVVELLAGDALIVPHKWWHYVQNMDTVNISLNMWLPHENDDSHRMSEALIKLYVAQLCKDLPSEVVKLLVNPTEDDILDTPLSVLLSQLQAATHQCQDKSQKKQYRKRQKICDNGDSESDSTYIDYDLNALVNNPDNKLEVPPIITGEELGLFIDETMSRYNDSLIPPQDNEESETSSAFSIVKNLINAFCQDIVVDQIRDNLMVQTSQL